MPLCEFVQEGNYCTNEADGTYRLGDTDEDSARHYDLCETHAPTNQEPIQEPDFK